MVTKLLSELKHALQSSPEVLRLEDEGTREVYVVLDEATHRRAMEVLQQHEDCDS